MDCKGIATASTQIFRWRSQGEATAIHPGIDEWICRNSSAQLGIRTCLSAAVVVAVFAVRVAAVVVVEVVVAVVVAVAVVWKCS